MKEQELPKIYDPAAAEDKWYRYWEEHNLFHAAPRPDRQPYTIMIPPPNVTGILHMGHALQGTLQDAIIRYRRMNGWEALWMPGTDHAGIATQNVVERKLRADNVTRDMLGREKFVNEVWTWKEKHGNIISRQLRKLGSSCDWQRERFTMDEGLSASVREVFVRLYRKQLIYRGQYIVNWCPRCRTAISDEEVDHKEMIGNLWHIMYPYTDGTGHVTVATTRPETMLGDTGVAVNPADERYRSIVGHEVILPLQERRIPVVADEFVDSSFGTGAVKVTPAHDPNDFDMGMRHKLERLEVIDDAGKMTSLAGAAYQGLDRFECRKQVVADLENLGLLSKVEEHVHQVGHCSRCKTVIEPRLSLQWFVKMKPLAEPAIAAVRDGRIHFSPPRWEKVYLDWMDNIRDWCISRQLWWGHRIPVWYCHDCDEVIVAAADPAQCSVCGGKHLRQDEDVLDTWFSSWLWPFSTLGWPEQTEELKYFYPTNVLVSGYDIIFFWIARMIMAGLEFTGKIPFSDVYITGMIKDAQGRIMSKSLNNGIDPLAMIEQYGADSVRYSLVALSTEGQDIKLSTDKFEMGRNFGNKVWNTYRFLQFNLANTPDTDQSPRYQLCDYWIASRLKATREKVADSFERYKLNEALGAIYEFLWHDYCDWYLELLKDRVGEHGSDPAILRDLAVPVFEETMLLLHPFMPFITEELWQGLAPDGERTSIMITRPGERAVLEGEAEAEQHMAVIQQVTNAVRNIRGEMCIPPQKTLRAIVVSTSDGARRVLDQYRGYLMRMARIDTLEITGTYKPAGATATAIVTDLEIYVPLEGLIDLDVERQRLEKERQRLEQQLKSISNKLGNDQFVANAPADVVTREREKFQETETNYQKILKTLQTLEGTA